MFSVSCPQCSNKMKAPEDLAGKKAKCSKCGHKFIIHATSIQDAEFRLLAPSKAPPVVSLSIADETHDEPATSVVARVPSAPNAVPDSREEFRSRPRSFPGGRTTAITLAAAIPVLGVVGFMLARSIPAQNEKAVVQGDPVQLAQPHLSDEAILQSAPGSSMTADQYFEYEAAFLRNTGDGRPFTEHSGKRVTWTCVIDQTDISTNGEVNLVFAHCPSAERLRLTLDQEKQLEILNQRRVVEERKSKEAELEWKKANPSAENVDDDKVRTLWEAYSAAQDTQLETMWKIAALVSKVGTYQQARGATRFALHFYNKSEWNQIKEAVAKKQRPPAQVPAWLTSIPELADLASSPELAADLASSKKSAVTATVEGILYPGKEISDLVSLRYCRLIEIFSAGE